MHSLNSGWNKSNFAQKLILGSKPPPVLNSWFLFVFKKQSVFLMQQSCLYYFDIRLWSSFLYFLQWSPNTMCPPVWDSFLKLCCFFVKDISALKQENEHLRQEVDKLKAELEYWEVRNGCKFRVSYACFAFFLLKLFYHWIEIGHAGFFFFSETSYSPR